MRLSSSAYVGLASLSHCVSAETITTVSPNIQTNMYVVVEHDISNPQSFWSTAQEGMSDLPGSLKLHHVLPDGKGTKAVCLWEADSEDEVRSFVEGAVGDASQNTYFAVDAENAVGLPAKATV